MRSVQILQIIVAVMAIGWTSPPDYTLYEQPEPPSASYDYSFLTPQRAVPQVAVVSPDVPAAADCPGGACELPPMPAPSVPALADGRAIARPDCSNCPPAAVTIGASRPGRSVLARRPLAVTPRRVHYVRRPARRAVVRPAASRPVITFIRNACGWCCR